MTDSGSNGSADGDGDGLSDHGSPPSTRPGSGGPPSMSDSPSKGKAILRNRDFFKDPDNMNGVDPLMEMMNDAVMDANPSYIFPAHEMVQQVRDLIKHCPDTDVVLKSSEGDISAHSVVLTARGGHLAEKVVGAEVGATIKMDDLNLDQLREVLRFVYTGTAPAASRIPRELLVAAHLTGLPALKERCSEVLVAQLCVENVVEMFHLADTNQEDRLKVAAAVFFLEKSKEVYDSEGWRFALERRPATAARLVQIAMHKNSIDLKSARTSHRIVHLLARIYLCAIVPVIGYLIYISVKNRRKQQEAGEAENITTTTDLI